MSLSALTLAIQDWQRVFHDRIALDLNALHDGGSMAALVTLAWAGFVYGLLHAAGPGHGKMVVGAYMMADKRTLKRGLVIVGLSSLMQAVVAIALVCGVFYGLGLARDRAEYAAAWLECLSFALVALIGAVLIVRGFMALDGHKHACGCGHDHAPVPVADTSRLAMLGMVVSIGIRPCSGALLLMFFACLVGEVWAGMAAVLAMAVGTAITTGSIAVAAAQSRKGLLRLVGRSEEALARASAIIRIIAGVAIFAMGALFLQASWPGSMAQNAPVNHPLMGRR